MSRGARITLLVILLALVLLGILAASKLTPYQEAVEHGPAPEAQANPYLAAEQFLQKQNLQVTQADNLEILKTLPSKGQTLLLLGDRGNMTPGQTKRALEWAAKGGHLLFVAERLWDEKEGKSGDLLLDSLGIEQYETDSLDDEEASDEATAETDENTDASEPSAAQPAEPEPDETQAVSYPELTQLFLQNEKAPAYINFDTSFHLYDAKNRAHAWANSESATHLLQTYHGDGLVTVLTDAWIWKNERIRQCLAALVHDPGQRGHADLSRGPGQPAHTLTAAFPTCTGSAGAAHRVWLVVSGHAPWPGAETGQPQSPSVAGTPTRQRPLYLPPQWSKYPVAEFAAGYPAPRPPASSRFRAAGGRRAMASAQPTHSSAHQRHQPSHAATA
jgi:hypothetical protein